MSMSLPLRAEKQTVETGLLGPRRSSSCTGSLFYSEWPPYHKTCEKCGLGHVCKGVDPDEDDADVEYDEVVGRALFVAGRIIGVLLFIVAEATSVWSAGTAVQRSLLKGGESRKCHR